MELKINRSRLVIGLTSIALAFALIGIVVAPRSTSQTVHPADSPGTCVDLAREVDPGKVRVDSAYDPERDLVFAEYQGRTYAMRPNDPLCRELRPARAVIDGMMDAHRENMVVACKSMREIVARNEKKFRGRSVNHEAARRFVSRRCKPGQ